MNKAIKFLALLLVAQVAVILGLNVGTANPESSQPKLLLQGIDKIDTLKLSDSDGESTLLKKEGDAWVMPDYGNLNVTEGKVDELLEKLRGAKVMWPVATTDAAAKRFEVSAENAQKILSFESDGKVVTQLYLGTSPSYRRLHARVDDSKDIFVIELAHHELPATSAEWLDKTLLQVEGDILGVKTDSFEVSRAAADDDSPWTLQPAPKGEVDGEAVAKWTKRFNNLIVSKLVPDDAVEAIIVQNPVSNVHVTSSNGEADYAFYRHDEKIYVKKFGETHVFEIAGYQANPLLDANSEGFLKAEDEAKAETTAQ
ncbi:uncharacterized protein DUF4340 [Alteromonadaceae bacterium 2753L.S.0a.02]|nr:uncharacterized protein DUF4340 [Alteromonadaceae bacterium 2753L.S.0a.02]